MTYDNSNPAHVAKAEKQAADELKDLDFILGQPRGRRWLYNLLHVACHIEQVSHVPGDADSTAFNEGARAVGNAILAEITDRPGLYIKMLEENHFTEEN